MQIKLFYLILIAVIGIVITVASVNAVLAASLTSTAANTGSGLYGKATQYVIKFKTATTGTIHDIVIVFPQDTLIPQAQVAAAIGVASTGTTSINLGQGTTAVTGSGGSTPTLTYTLASDQSVQAGTMMFLYVIKISNTDITGSTHLTVTTRATGASTIDGPTDITFGIGDISQGPFTLDSTNNRVGINNASPAHDLDVGGDIGLSGNFYNTGATGSTLKIIPATNGAICIGTGC